MSDDLVKQLRNHEEQQQVAGQYWWETPEVCIEAADHIEALTADLEAAKEALRKLSTAQCMGNGGALGVNLPTHPIGQEVFARMQFARATLAKLEDEQ